jgi:hypothetical protein
MRALLVCAVLWVAVPSAFAQDAIEYRVAATNRTSTMQKEMQEAGGRVSLIFERNVDAARREKYEYQLLATNKTSTMEKERQQAGHAGF